MPTVPRSHIGLRPAQRTILLILMSNDLAEPAPPYWRSRYGFAAFFYLSLLVAWFVLRLVLFLAFKPADLPVADVLRAFISGFHRDVFIGLVQSIPLLLWF